MMDNNTIDKVLQGTASGQEARDVACWFEHPKGTLELVERIDRDLNREWNKQYATSVVRSSAHHWLYRVACALLIVVCSLASGYSVYRHYIQPVPVEEQVAYADRGERTQVVLQDGTRIYLNSGSHVSFPSRFSLRERRIHLDGEAYFEVAKNTHRPFILELDHACVTVLGTCFNAKSYAGSPVCVTLDEGSVRFSAPNIDDVLLKPGEEIRYDITTAKASVNKTSVQTAGAWRFHRVEMNMMPLADVIAMMERNYNVTFRVHNSKCYNHSFTLSMGDESLNMVLARMDKLSPLTFRYNESTRVVEVY